MRGKIIFVTGIAIGYVFGARAGHERYLEIKRSMAKLWNDPRVQQQVKQAEAFAKEKTPEVVDFLSDGAKKVAAQARKTTKSPTQTDGGSASKPKAASSNQ